MKKIKILGLLAMLFLAAACNNENNVITNEPQQGVTFATEETQSIPTVTTIQNEDEPYVVINDSPYQMVFDGLGVALIDFSTGETVGTFEPGEMEMFWNFFNLNNGYFASLVEYGIPEGGFMSIEDEDGSRVIIMDDSGDEIHQDDITLKIIIFDNELEIVDELVITNEHLQDSIVRFSMDVVYESGELFIYYMTDFMRVHWGEEEYQSIHRYNIHTNTTYTLARIEELLSLPKVRCIGDFIAFTGSTEDEILQYGFIDLRNDTTTRWEESNFSINSYDQLQTVGSTVLIREILAPPVMGQWEQELVFCVGKSLYLMLKLELVS